MDIAKYTTELLFNYECVIIPGLGGFIVNDRPATVNRINHQFRPPFRKIMFNVHLKANDGLLINHMVTSLDVSYKQARLAVDQFVSEVNEKLENGETVILEKLGNIHFDNNRNIVFEQDPSVNYNPDAYGLTGFVSAPVKRASEKERLREIIAPKKSETRKPVDRKPEGFIERNKKKKSLRPVFFGAAFIILLAATAWGLFNPDQIRYYWENSAALIPAAYNGAGVNAGNIVNEARYIPRSFVEGDKEILAKTEAFEKANTAPTDAPSESAVLPDHPDVAETEMPEAGVPDETKQPITTIEPSGPLYYIIAGSFSDAENAGNLVDDLRQKGYQARIADTNSNGMYRVAYVGIKNLSEAKQTLFAIRQEDNPEAWIFRK